MRSDMVAVVIAGGSGTRFWPVSTADRPKQFLPLLGRRTLLQSTVDRLEGLVPPERTIIVTAARFAAEVQAQLPHIPAANIIGEPQGRDTAAAITAAGFAIEQCERIAFRSAPLEPRLPYILGRARLP